jgi:tetratricopeptide (TPR) repeat protein
MENYDHAIKLDPSQKIPWLRKVIELQLLSGQHEPAWAGIESYLELPDLSQSERAWAMGEKAHLLVDRGSFQDARELLSEAMNLEAADPADQGQFYYWLGYCDWKLGHHGDAERSMRVARDLLQVRHPLDADAAYALGRIRQDQNDLTGAMSFYALVLQSHLDKPVAWSAKLARAICRISLGDTEAGLADLQEVMRRIDEKPARSASLRQQTLVTLRQAEQLLTDGSKLEASLEVMAHEQQLEPKPQADFFGRLSRVYERRAEQVEKVLVDATPQERNHVEAQVRDLRAKAGDGYVAYSRALTLIDDKAYGQTLWKGVEQYERAGDLHRVIASLKTFVDERPNDPQSPAAMLKLGHSYHAVGRFDDAIKTYRDNQFRYPNSLAASKSGVPLARAYIAKGPDFYGKAEEVLLAVVENNPQVTPEAEEFRESLWELASLYYRGGEFESAVARLEEIIQRYPGDERLGQLRFLMADSYRKSAATLDQKIVDARSTAATKPVVDVAEATRAKTDRMTRAADLYAQVIEQYRRTNASKDLDRLYLKLSHFYRADCTFDLGNYEEAIRLYGDAAFRYQDDASTLAAYVQIVNANVALGRTEEAKAANERAKWLLRRMPGEAFSDGSFGGTKVHWEQWLKWSGEIGMWSE